MLALQILVDGFAVSALYGVGAVGFTLIFGVSGVLNLSHGAIMVVAAVTAWATAGGLGFGRYGGAAATDFAYAQRHQQPLCCIRVNFDGTCHR